MQDISATFFQLAPLSHLVLDNAGKIIMSNPASETLLGASSASLQGISLIDYVHEADKTKYRTWLETKHTLLQALMVHLELAANGKPMRVLLHGRKTTDTIIISLSRIPQQISDENNTPSNSSELQRLQVSNALHASLLAITKTLDLAEVLDKILENVSLAIPHDAADIMLITDNIAHIMRSRGYDQHNLQEVVTSLRFPLDSTPTLSRMVKTKSPIIIDDMRQYNAWVERPQQEWMRAYVGVPIQILDKVIGFLNLVSGEVSKFNEEHLEWLNVFATQAAVAINNARTHKQASEFAVAEERLRIAREIHDTVSQMLFSSSMIAESLAIDNQFTDVNLLKQLRHIFRLNRGALAEMRMLLMEYKPENLVKAELPILLERLKQAIEGRTEIEVDIDIDDGHPAPPETRLALYRIAQEALNNVSKHSNAAHARIHFVSTKRDVTLEITDEGTGFDTDKLSKGDGLHNMRTRAEAIGATFTVNSTIGEGTTIRVHWLRDSDT